MGDAPAARLPWEAATVPSAATAAGRCLDGAMPADSVLVILGGGMGASRATVAEATGVFGQVVTAHRKQRGLTQEALAAATGLSARRISELESGRVGRPRTSTLAMLADAFGLS